MTSITLIDFHCSAQKISFHKTNVHKMVLLNGSVQNQITVDADINTRSVSETIIKQYIDGIVVPGTKNINTNFLLSL